MSVLHLRNTSDPWEVNPASIFTSSTDRQFSRAGNIRGLTKHQSLSGSSGQNKWSTYSGLGFHSGEEVNSTDLFVSGTCNRELSPVRWCDREVDGVYLGRSGWVQVQQRSLDENRRVSYTPSSNATSSLQSSRRTGIKLAQYHCNSEPGKCPEVSKVSISDHQRPLYLSLQSRDFETKTKTPSPRPIPESFSPPSITPIISPPPAFQDKNKTPSKSRTFFGKTPFLPRSNAIEDSDASPPASPTLTTKKSPVTIPVARKPKPVISPVTELPRTHPRIPQTKSLENTSTNRRSQFTQRYGESSSSSSSSMGFRSLDSCMNRPTMPRLSENTDSSVDVYEDADDEDNNSSSLNISIAPSVMAIPPVDSLLKKEKLSPSSRGSRTPHHRSQTRRSPVGSDTTKQGKSNSPSSSSTSSAEFPTRSPSGTLQQLRRSNQSRTCQSNKTSQEDASLQRVRRSRSLQLPDKKPVVGYRERISPQHPEAHRVVVKIGNAQDRQKRSVSQSLKSQTLDGEGLDENMLREAEVVTEFLYGSRSKAAAQALFMHNKYNNSSRDEGVKGKPPINNGYNIYVVGNKPRDRQKVLQRGSTSPNLPSTRNTFASGQEAKNPCNPETCDFWPHCAHRGGVPNQPQPMMRLSQSYPSHQRSLDSANTEINRPSTVLERPTQELYKKRVSNSGKIVASSHASRKSITAAGFASEIRERRPSPNKVSEGKYDGGVDSGYDVKTSPINLKRPSPTCGNSSNSSSSSDVWLTTSDRTVSKSPRNAKGSGTSTPLEELPINSVREIILTRPGSAPTEDSNVNLLESQQRSLSLPKSFLSVTNYPHR